MLPCLRLCTAQPPHATPKKAHPSCLAVVCPRCPSLPEAGSTVIPASAALPLPSCSWPRNWLLPSPGQQPWPPGLSRAVKGPECIPPLPCAVSSLGQGGPGVSRRCWAWEQHTGVLGEGSQQGGKAGGLDAGHIPALGASFDPYTYWKGGTDRESSQQGGH